MRNFYGFHRKAVIVLTTDDELKSRITKRKEEAEGEEIKESSMLEVKGENIRQLPTIKCSIDKAIPMY